MMLIQAQDLFDPMALRRAVGTPRRHQSETGGKFQVRYNADYVVQSSLMADLLRNDADLTESIRQALRMVLPTQLLPSALLMIDSCKDIVPHKGTLSRWRLLIDGAMMNTYRTLLQEHFDGGGVGFARYFMADSSEQHGLTCADAPQIGSDY